MAEEGKSESKTINKMLKSEVAKYPEFKEKLRARNKRQQDNNKRNRKMRWESQHSSQGARTHYQPRIVNGNVVVEH